MKEKIKKFFEVSCSKVTEHLLPGARILLTAGEDTYVLKIGDEREVIVDKDTKKEGDMEIKGEREVMDDIFSSSDPEDLFGRMGPYIRNRKSPQVKILLERTVENARYFQRGYYHFLREMNLLK